MNTRRYTVDLVKQQSSRAKYEYWRGVGIQVPDGKGGVKTISHDALDDYTNQQIWRTAHPGQSQVKEIES